MVGDNKYVGLPSKPSGPLKRTEGLDAHDMEDLGEIPPSAFLWILLYDLRTIHDIDISDDELDFILLDALRIFPIEEALASYVRWKNEISIDRIEALLFALKQPVTAIKHRILGREEPKMLKGICILDDLGFDVCSIVSISQAGNYARGALLMIMIDPGLAGVLLRAMIELWVKGLLIEHLRTHIFRTQVEERAYRDKRRNSVARLVRFLSRTRNKQELRDSVGPAVLHLEHFNWVTSLPKVKVTDIIDWLEEWGVLPRNLRLGSYIKDTWRRLCVEIHGDLLKGFTRKVWRDESMDVLIDELFKLSDILLLGLLNTIENTAKNRLWRVDDEAWASWKKWIEGAELPYASRKIYRLSILRAKLRRKRLEREGELRRALGAT